MQSSHGVKLVLRYVESPSGNGVIKALSSRSTLFNKLGHWRLLKLAQGTVCMVLG